MDNIKPLNVNIKVGVINGTLYNIYDYEEYANLPDQLKKNSGIFEDHNGTKIILPYKGNSIGEQPGIYNAGCVDFCVYPDEESLPQYIPRKVVELNNNDSMKSILEKNESISKLDEPWITSPDSITQFGISEEDQPEMICLKRALNCKQMDFDKYSNRFGDNFPNDKRQLKNNSVTLNIIKRFCDKCDMEAILTLRDKNPSVPNPMGQEISMSLTDSYSSEDDE